MLTGPIELTQRIATCAYRFSEQLITGRLMYMRRKYFFLPLAINLRHNGEKKSEQRTKNDNYRFLSN